MELVNLIDAHHELGKLTELIDWQALSDAWCPQLTCSTGLPALPTRLMAALLYMKHLYALSDEEVVERWCKNPFWQHFSGERYFSHDLLCDPPVKPGALAPAHWRGRLRMAAGPIDRCGQCRRDDQAVQCASRGAGHHGAAQGGGAPHGQPAAGQVPGATGAGGSGRAGLVLRQS